jgi:hypothetical protein
VAGAALWAYFISILHDMARSGALQLKDYPTDVVRLACTHCPRKGQYRKVALMMRFGKDMSLPTLRTLIAKCDREDKLGSACGIYYVELARKK